MFKYMEEHALIALSCSGNIKQIFFDTDLTDGNPNLKSAELFGLELQKKENQEKTPTFLKFILQNWTFRGFMRFLLHDGFLFRI